ncbi:N-6 DNA methylase [Chryseobacterium sp. POL2]|uniref:Eco57I restriction-modification methylase domain-containing protein n=1 Tax=Chryseobacterium sp. POL2 TaxID=2713414 RepID=UPI0013E1D149|nr:TaqI-like C-terminal specificity domain-containing protein [Chryseobacterium sp. POL2]QIG88545.1 N-6 DNA methylase [Chryseobacterium sp. POL2]
MQKQVALDKIKSLVQRFDEQKEFYKRTEYNETQTRRDFIDPFWKALGWDIDNENGYAESYREVIHEDRVKVGGATKAPDYSFRLVGGKRLFFLEAKKPSVSIKSDIQPAYQVRRYGWSAKMPISIITDFEEFAIYDCNTKPKPNDKASNGRIKYLTYDNYISEFDFIWDTFAKERVLRGSFDKYITSDKHKKGTSTVDNEFLQSLDKWRKELALNIALRNKNITEEELNFVVQHTIDRIIFLRIAEDRSVEQYGDLQTDIKSGDFYQNLLFRFHQANQKYNSGLFDFEKDKISKEISIDNKVVKSIISELYYPICPYEFSVLSVEILGSAYEQFLGKQISLSANGRAIIEEKPEVRKAGGVYYTPQYIVDYIVENTIGKQIQNKTPKEISKLKVVDPACGSGSFLIGAYQYLLDWHKDYYSNNGKPSKGNKNNPLTPLGELTTAEKKRILLNNIYGVDLDSNAVEVTKLSLLLKCMEGETKETIEAQTKLFHDRILPTLDNNIKSGNSLIDLDYYDNEIDFGEERKVKPFSWQKAFPVVFKNGGFDCVIGNPPYVVIEGEFRNEETLSYFKSNYKSASYKIDLYHLFFEKGLELLKPNGQLGFITPSNFLANNNLLGLRETILNNSYIEMLNVINGKVFVGASVDTTVSILAKSNNKKKSKFIHSQWNKNRLDENSNEEFNQDVFNQNEGKMFVSTKKKSKLNAKTFELGTKYFVKFGMQLRDRKKFVADVIDNSQNDLITEFHRPCYTGKNVQKWNMQYSNLLAYFNREAKRGGCWDENMHYANPKIIVRQIGAYPICALDEKGYACLNTVFMIVPKSETNIDLKFVLAVLNSKFIADYWTENFSDLRQTFPKIKGSYLEKLPIPEIGKNQQNQHNEVVKQTNQLLNLIEELQNTTLPNRIELLKNRIEYTENKINELIYELYGAN